MSRRLFLRLGDRVFHRAHEEWGEGAVVEEMTSILESGTCIVRILFEDGQKRTFHNDMENELCCYYFGIRKERQPVEVLEPRTAPRRGATRRRLA